MKLRDGLISAGTDKACERCMGKGFCNMDGSPDNAFVGSDYDTKVRCSVCGGTGKADAAVSTEKEAEELLAAGWLKIRGRLWKAPVGGYFVGPHGAWCAMKRRREVENGPDTKA